jgi:hypothetical protein
MTLNALTTPTHLKNFLAGTQGMSAVPDFDVEKDPRPGPILANPARTLAIQETAVSQVMRSSGYDTRAPATGLPRRRRTLPTRLGEIKTCFPWSMRSKI